MHLRDPRIVNNVNTENKNSMFKAKFSGIVFTSSHRSVLR
jgi:hypothetical protein